MLPISEETPELELELDDMSAVQLQTELSIRSSDEPYREEPHQPYKPKSLIRGGISDANIVTTKQRKIPSSERRAAPNERRAAYFTELERPQELPAFRAAFSAGLQHGRTERDRLHHDQLSLAPHSWKKMLRHPHKKGFLAAANKEYSDLERWNTFRVVKLTTAIPKLLPLMWVFTYKFDDDDYLIKYKA